MVSTFSQRIRRIDINEKNKIKSENGDLESYIYIYCTLYILQLEIAFKHFEYFSKIQ